MKSTKLFVTLVLFLNAPAVFSMPLQEVKKAAKEVGSTSKDTGKKIGKAGKETGKEIGQSGKKAGKELGTVGKKIGKSFSKTFKEATH